MAASRWRRIGTILAGLMVLAVLLVSGPVQAHQSRDAGVHRQHEVISAKPGSAHAVTSLPQARPDQHAVVAWNGPRSAGHACDGHELCGGVTCCATAGCTAPAGTPCAGVNRPSPGNTAAVVYGVAASRAPLQLAREPALRPPESSI